MKGHAIIGFNHGVLGLAENPALGPGFFRQNTSGLKKPVPRAGFSAKPSTPWLKPITQICHRMSYVVTIPENTILVTKTHLRGSPGVFYYTSWARANQFRDTIVFTFAGNTRNNNFRSVYICIGNQMMVSNFYYILHYTMETLSINIYIYLYIYSLMKILFGAY